MSDSTASSSPRIAVVDYGMGNRRSVEKALERVGAVPIITADHQLVRAADGVVVPGVGAFPPAMQALRATGLDGVVRDCASAGVPVLGLCLGMQLLFDGSEEHGGEEGLGLLSGRIRALQAGALKLPHIGWNEVTWTRESALITELPNPATFYHVHSFVAQPEDPDDVLGTCEYGERFASVVSRANVHGVQFHPEKSSTYGLRLLSNFSALCVGAPA